MPHHNTSTVLLLTLEQQQHADVAWPISAVGVTKPDRWTYAEAALETAITNLDCVLLCEMQSVLVPTCYLPGGMSTTRTFRLPQDVPMRKRSMALLTMGPLQTTGASPCLNIM